MCNVFTKSYIISFNYFVISFNEKHDARKSAIFPTISRPRLYKKQKATHQHVIRFELQYQRMVLLSTKTA